MLGIPGPASVAAAAANFYDAAVRGGLADLRRMPAALIDHGRLRSLYRYLASMLSSLTCLIGYFIAINHPKKQTLHDRLVGTVVVRK